MTPTVPTTTSSDPDGFIARRYAQALDRIVEDLRELAEKVESVGRPSAAATSAPYTTAATSVIARLMNALPNLSLATLIETASTMDALVAVDAAAARATELAEDRQRSSPSAAVEDKRPARGEPDYIGSNPERQSIGDPGHCERCVEVGHVVAHPDLGCGDVGCTYSHD